MCVYEIKVYDPKTSSVLRIYPDLQRITLDGAPFLVNYREYRLLLQLGLCKGGLVTKDVLVRTLDKPWSGERGSENMLRVTVSRLRRRFAEATEKGALFIHSVSYEGYTFKDLPSQPVREQMPQAA